MIVVAIVGVLAVLATYGVRKYIANAKTAEAQNSIGQMAKDAATAFEREGMQSTVLTTKSSSAVARHLCASATATVPSSSAAISGRKYQSTAAEWSAGAPTNTGFACLKFSIDSPQYYMYSYGATGTAGAAGDTFTASAQGDLNADGVLSLFQITGSVTSALSVAVAPNILVVRPDD
jgi:type IV pilus assembly protein PilA